MRKILILILILLLASSASALNITNSTISCLDNTTLLENITVYKDGNISNLWTAVKCDYGCENAVCSDSPELSAYKTFGLLILIVILVVGFDRFVLRRGRK